MPVNGRPQRRGGSTSDLITGKQVLKKKKGHATRVPFLGRIWSRPLVARRTRCRGLLCCRRPRHGCFMSGRGRGSFSRLLHDRSAGTQGQGNATQDRSQNDQFFHKLIDTTNTASSQVASPDVLKSDS